MSNNCNNRNIPLIGIGDYKQNFVGFFTDKLVISNNVNLNDFITNLGLIKNDLREFIIYTSNDYSLESIHKILANENINPVQSITNNINSNIILCKT